jgi:hypothetical protein
MEVKELLNKHIDATKNDGFHIYAVLKDIEQHGIWVELNSELIFFAFTNLKEIRLDRRYKGES